MSLDLEVQKDEVSYPCSPICLIAIGEMQRRHQMELTEVLQAAKVACNLPEGFAYALDMQSGKWVQKES